MVFIIVTAILFFDQLSKFILTKYLAQNQSIPVINGVFHLTLIYNRGAAFGILRNQVPLFIVTSIFAVILIYFAIKKNSHRKLYSLALCLILAGALGNLADRLFFGYVIDFLDFRIWPVFNLADSAITIGAVLLSWEILFKKDHYRPN